MVRTLVTINTLTSLIYASFTFIFFALEVAIARCAGALDIPLTVGYFVGAVVGVVWSPQHHPDQSLSGRHPAAAGSCYRLPLICVALQSDDAFDRWVDFEPQAIGSPPHFSLIAFGGASACCSR